MLTFELALFRNEFVKSSAELLRLESRGLLHTLFVRIAPVYLYSIFVATLLLLFLTEYYAGWRAMLMSVPSGGGYFYPA